MSHDDTIDEHIPRVQSKKARKQLTNQQLYCGPFCAVMTVQLSTQNVHFTIWYTIRVASYISCTFRAAYSALQYSSCTLFFSRYLYS